MLRGMRVERAGSRVGSEFVILDTGQLLNLPGGAAHTVLRDRPALFEVGRDRRKRELGLRSVQPPRRREYRTTVATEVRVRGIYGIKFL